MKKFEGRDNNKLAQVMNYAFQDNGECDSFLKTR